MSELLHVLEKSICVILMYFICLKRLALTNYGLKNPTGHNYISAKEGIFYLSLVLFIYLFIIYSSVSR